MVKELGWRGFKANVTIFEIMDNAPLTASEILSHVKVYCRFKSMLSAIKGVGCQVAEENTTRQEIYHES